MDLDIYKTFHLTAESTFFSSAHGTLSGIDHGPGQKRNRGKFKVIEILSSIFSNIGIRLEITRRKSEKFANMWKLKTIKRNQWIKEIKREI